MDNTPTTLINESGSRIRDIYSALYRPFIDEETKILISQFVDAYHATLDEYLATENPSVELSIRLQMLSGPINEVYDLANPELNNGAISYPAVDLIRSKIDSYGASVEKSFTRVRIKPGTGTGQGFNEDNFINQINGFSNALAIVAFTLALGIVLGTLMFYLIKIG